MPDLSAMLERGPVVCAEGYLFECERRGYLQAGAFVPEVVLDHPDVVEELHREFVHAGSDVVEAFTYYGHRQKLRSSARRTSSNRSTGTPCRWRPGWPDRPGRCWRATCATQRL